MDLAEFTRIAERSTDRFRLEVLPTYRVPQEAEDLAAWQQGNRTLATPESSDWLAHIHATTSAGVRWSRVRVLDYPLTDYSKFELHGYQANALAGERIYIADRAWSPELADLRDDFWIFDETVVAMIYDQDGRFMRPELADESQAQRFRGERSVALRHSQPLRQFLAAREPRLIA